jgi:rhodanese-related sulfurtransferase
MGYLKVTSITGGIDAWIDAGKPVAKPALPAFD